MGAYARIVYESDRVHGSIVCPEERIAQQAASLLDDERIIDVETFEAWDFINAIKLIDEHEEIEDLELEPHR